MKYPLVKDLLAKQGGSVQLTGAKTFITKKYRRTRLKSPKACAKDSFRTMTVNHDTQMIVCCPRRHFNKRTGRCKTGVIVQSKLKRR